MAKTPAAKTTKRGRSIAAKTRTKMTREQWAMVRRQMRAAEEGHLPLNLPFQTFGKSLLTGFEDEHMVDEEKPEE